MVAGVLLVGGLGFFIFNDRKENGSSGQEQASLITGSAGNADEPTDEPAVLSPDSSSAPLGDQTSGSSTSTISTGSTASKTFKLAKTYSNAEIGLSFNYPDGFNVSGFAEGEIGYTILAQKSGSRESFQIFVSDFDEPGPITPPRIEKDIPDIVIESPQEVLIGKDKKIQALIFFSKNESLGRTREVWFVQNGNLYQLTAYADLDGLIGPVLETLKFK